MTFWNLAKDFSICTFLSKLGFIPIFTLIIFRQKLFKFCSSHCLEFLIELFKLLWLSICISFTFNWFIFGLTFGFALCSFFFFFLIRILWFLVIWRFRFWFITWLWIWIWLFLFLLFRWFFSILFSILFGLLFGFFFRLLLCRLLFIFNSI